MKLEQALLAAQGDMPHMQRDAINPSGLCMCGCGKPTTRAKQTYTRWGVRKGEHHRFVTGHNIGTHRRSRTSRYQKDASLRHFYGISLDEYDAMVDKQGGRCALCDKHVPKLAVDHDHESGRVRALLCVTCNTRLGAIENEEFAVKARAYLESHR